MTLAKICGVCRPEDAAVAAEAGAAYVGVILAPGRMRTQTVSQAGEIFEAAGPLLRVGVFVDAAPAEVLAAARRLLLDVVQLHGAESPAMVAALRRAGAPAIWKATRVVAPASLAGDLAAYGSGVDALLLDGGQGGGGEPFDWAAVAGLRPSFPAGLRLVVAGGLTPDNVARAVAALAPDVADVSSGVEASPGRKDAAAVRAFVRAVAPGSNPERR